MALSTGFENSPITRLLFGSLVFFSFIKTFLYGFSTDEVSFWSLFDSLFTFKDYFTFCVALYLLYNLQLVEVMIGSHSFVSYSFFFFVVGFVIKTILMFLHLYSHGCYYLISFLLVFYIKMIPSTRNDSYQLSTNLFISKKLIISILMIITLFREGTASVIESFICILIAIYYCPGSSHRLPFTIPVSLYSSIMSFFSALIQSVQPPPNRYQNNIGFFGQFGNPNAVENEYLNHFYPRNVFPIHGNNNRENEEYVEGDVPPYDPRLFDHNDTNNEMNNDSFTDHIEVTEDHIETLMGMGFPREECIRALKKRYDDVNAAANDLMN